MRTETGRSGIEFALKLPRLEPLRTNFPIMERADTAQVLALRVLPEEAANLAATSLAIAQHDSQPRSNAHLTFKSGAPRSYSGDKK